MKEMAAFVDEQAGGPGKGWLQIAYSAEDARKIIGDNKLAVILGVEVDLLGTGTNKKTWTNCTGGDLEGRQRPDRQGTGLAL